MADKIELLNKAEAAERARIAPVTLDKFIRSGDGPAVTRVGGKVFIQPAHLNEWLQSRVTPAKIAIAPSPEMAAIAPTHVESP
jgi:predicted site-specific integrase-resolvase